MHLHHHQPWQTPQYPLSSPSICMINWIIKIYQIKNSLNLEIPITKEIKVLLRMITLQPMIFHNQVTLLRHSPVNILRRSSISTPLSQSCRLRKTIHLAIDWALDHYKKRRKSSIARIIMPPNHLWSLQRKNINVIQ